MYFTQLKSQRYRMSGSIKSELSLRKNNLLCLEGCKWNVLSFSLCQSKRTGTHGYRNCESMTFYVGTLWIVFCLITKSHSRKIKINNDQKTTALASGSFFSVYPFQGCTEAGAYPGCHRVRGTRWTGYQSVVGLIQKDRQPFIPIAILKTPVNLTWVSLD